MSDRQRRRLRATALAHHLKKVTIGVATDDEYYGLQLFNSAFSHLWTGQRSDQPLWDLKRISNE